jgi:hypothetical protein
MTGVHLAAATIGQIGHDQQELAVDLLAAFATVLGIKVDYLTVLSPAGISRQGLDSGETEREELSVGVH